MTETEGILTEVLPTLLIGAAGAALFWAIGFPAAVLTGPAAAVSLATLLGLRSRVPLGLRDAVFLVIGISIGSTVTPEVVATALAWPVSLAILTGTLVLVLVLVRAILAHGFGYDPLTALLAATPGHLSYVLGLSTDLKADVPRVALVQSVRVLLLTLLVPVLISLWGAEGTAYLPDRGTMSPVSALAVFGLAVALGLVFRRFGVPAPLLLGAMAASAAGHGSNLTPGALPPWATTVAFVVMGSLIGTRFRGLDRRGLLGAFAAGAAATFVACAVAAAGAVLAARIVDLPPAALLLAFAPGGVEVMAALAVETGLEPAFVAAHHVFRLVVLSVLMPIVLARRRVP
ncbi:AbrB family transcriptional regulator [Roseibacterium sp. SDUM158017]|uniref:AbrB family transcriptional regulator n=1 Tax=Roseicyclus salinarum TaxID=3036773 RepID=UPI002414F1FC|nr:AbrB family transcriptional regulator [Roseibacterium sp. SDUM158017]MDG4648135.1 AbrB family transcriptional regulator [Roseibacterium sp. SDUM158017]